MISPSAVYGALCTSTRSELRRKYWVLWVVHWKLAPCWAAQLLSLNTGRVNVSDNDKVLGISSPAAAQCPGQPSLRAKSENVKLNDKIDRLLCAQTTHRYTQMLCKLWTNIYKRPQIFWNTCKEVIKKLLYLVLCVVLTWYCLLSFF